MGNGASEWVSVSWGRREWESGSEESENMKGGERRVWEGVNGGE